MSSFSLHIGFKQKELVSIDNFEIEEGKLNILFGESGIGKSLILKSLSGLLDESKLSVEIDRKPYSSYLESDFYEKVKRGFYVFQEPSSYFNPLQTVEEQINEHDLSNTKINEQLFNDLWDEPTWKAILDVYPKDYRPSGGEKQRLYNLMAFKKMLNTEKGLFVFDEPTGNLDEFHRNKFLDLLMMHYKNFFHTVVLITHDYSMIDFFNLHYSKENKSIVYKELIREESALSLRDFNTKEYIDLYNDFESTLANPISNQTILKFGKSLEFFGGEHSFIQNGEVKSLEVSKSAITYLKARSGAGKTTVAKIIMGLVKADKFAFELSGHLFNENTAHRDWETKVWGKCSGLVFQHPDRALNPEATVWEIFKHLPVENMSKSLLLNELSRVFTTIDLSFLDKKTSELSGGQKQRINLMRTFLLNTDLVILDEPFTGIDLNTMKVVFKLIKEKLDSGTAFLLISHNESLFDRIIPKSNVWQLAKI